MGLKGVMAFTADDQNVRQFTANGERLSIVFTRNFFKINIFNNYGLKFFNFYA